MTEPVRIRQLSLTDNVVDLDAARATAAIKRDAGITRSSDAAGDDWNDRALELVRTYLEQHPEFFGDEFWPFAEANDLEFRGRALGAVVTKANRAGWMTKAGYRPSVRSNLSPKVVWRSELYDVEHQEIAR